MSTFDSQILATSRPGASNVDSAGAVKKLETKIAGFQAILNDDDRKKLHQLKTTSHDAQSIITFTAELDRFNPSRRGKSVASRLASFLQTIEQFTPIIDTYVQSNPDIAALIWGSIKLTFMFLANFTSYFQSFVELLHGFGSLCTRFAEYQVVFNDSLRLKKSICQFHTAVVTCCEKIVVAIRRPLKTQVWKAITQSFQIELRSYVEDIRTKAENAQGDIELVKAHLDREEQHLQTKERKQASEHRKRLFAWTSKSSAEMKAIETQRKKSAAEQKRHRLLQELSSYNFTSAFNITRNKRHLGTAEWIFETSEFQEWRTTKKPIASLHITGKIGSGKTVLASSTVEKLCQIRPPQQFTSFFFLRFDDSQSLIPETIIRSCVQQALSAISMDNFDPLIAPDIDELLERAKQDMFSTVSLLNLYAAASSIIEDWFIVLDGLDECSPSHQSDLLKFFQRIPIDSNVSRPTPRIKLMFSSRETSSSTVDRIFPHCPRLMTGVHHTSADIGAYAQDIIDDKLSSRELVVGDPGLVKEILDTIVSREQGMFLWAFLTIQDICSRKTDKEIRKALQEIPADLPTTFDRALSRIVQRHDQDIAKRTFAWTAAVTQSLTLPQLREALSIEIGQRSLHQDDLISGIDRLTAWCENLVYVEETDNTVHFSHHSIREFLLTPDSGKLQALHIDADECSQLVGEICITYISLDNFETALTERSHGNVDSAALNLNMGGMAEQTIQTAVKGKIGSQIGRLARHAVKSPFSSKASTSDPSILSFPSPMSGSAQGTPDYPFFEYAKENWFKHTMSLSSKANQTTWRLLGRIISRPRQFSQNEPWQDTAWRQKVEENPDSLFGSGHKSYGKTIPSSKLYKQFFFTLKSSTEPSDGSMLADLCFAFIYADYHHNWGLACRAFDLIVNKYWMSRRLGKYGHLEGLLERFIHVLAANKNHKACRNQCLSLVRPSLNHQTFVPQLRDAIANGVEYYPPLGEGEVVPACDCAQEARYPLQEDICKLLVAGYWREEQPHLQAFAIMAKELERGTQLTNIRRLSRICQIEFDALVNARTISGRSLFDVLVEGTLHNLDLAQSGVEFQDNRVAKTIGRPLIRSFYPDGLNIEGDMSFKVQATNAIFLLCSLRDGINPDFEEVKRCLGQCSFSGGILPLHEATITRIFVELVVPSSWPFRVAQPIVDLFFGKSIPQGLESTHENIFRQAVWHNNWVLAKCLMLHQPVATEIPFSSSFSYIRRVIRCIDCQDLTKNRMGSLQDMDLTRNSYGLCSAHLETMHTETYGEIFDERSKAILCSGTPTESLPRQEDDGIMRGFGRRS